MRLVSTSVPHFGCPCKQYYYHGIIAIFESQLHGTQAVYTPKGIATYTQHTEIVYHVESHIRETN